MESGKGLGRLRHNAAGNLNPFLKIFDTSKNITTSSFRLKQLCAPSSRELPLWLSKHPNILLMYSKPFIIPCNGPICFVFVSFSTQYPKKTKMRRVMQVSVLSIFYLFFQMVNKGR
jgi:hypothetical protein